MTKALPTAVPLEPWLRRSKWGMAGGKVDAFARRFDRNESVGTRITPKPDHSWPSDSVAMASLLSFLVAAHSWCP